MRTLIIGGTRFIGPSVVHRLAGAGHEVTVLHRGRSEAGLPPSVRHLHADRRGLDVVAADLRALLPDVVLDMAPYTEQDAAAVIDAVRGVARRLVAVSSQDVYRAYGRLHRTEPGAPEAVPLTEDSPLRERLYPYQGQGRGLDDYDKIPVERLVMSNPDLPGTVLRLPMVYGERDEQRRLGLELRHMDDRRPAILLEEPFARWRWTRAYVENAAAAIALAVANDRAASRIYNVGEAESRPYADWVRAIGKAAGWQGEVVVAPEGRLPAQLRPPDADYRQDLVADTSRLRNELGYIEPFPLFQGLVRAIDWERRRRSEQPPREVDYAAEDTVLAELRGEALTAPAAAPPPSADPPLPHEPGGRPG